MAAVRPILGGTDREIREEIPLARIYSAYHARMAEMGHPMQWPRVVAARQVMAKQYMEQTIERVKAAPLQGLAPLD